jgi:hypothetical protein
MEAGYCDQLSILLDTGNIKAVEYQKAFRLDINGSHIATYYADFYVQDNDGLWTIHEVKGAVTEVYRLKKKMTRVLFPEIPFIEIK